MAATHTTSHHQQESKKETQAAQSSKKKDSSEKASNTDSEDSANKDNESNDSSDNASNDTSSDTSSAADSAHHASYDQGTADWNAQVGAIASATGIDQNNMVIYWLGNGGAPNSSLARVAAKSAPSQKYVVHLVYKGGKWQAESVQKP
ncbi:DUF1510 family protein [Terrilactibacillus sp. S3-3]|nr:DUF1510 family protein [Terrilactibacillus sp. S3-3]